MGNKIKYLYFSTTNPHFCEQDFLDAQPISNPERLMMASEMDMDEAEEEAMAIEASELGIKIGAKV